MAEIRIDGARLWDSLMAMGAIGATPNGGSGRLALTDLDREARDLFVSWCEAAGCALRVDRMGNIFARRPGSEPDRAPVMTGSHLDTQPLGGKFDGVYGVLAGLEVVRSLNDAGVRTRAPLDVVVWTDEEGARFKNGIMGSGVFAGLYGLEAALANSDADGRTMGAELERIGYAGTEPVGGLAVDAYFEAHIEQGPLLEAEGKTVGVVLGAQGQRCFRVTVTGAEGHAGTLPMDRRRDALLGAARMIDGINAIAFRHQPHPVITVGRLEVRPNSPNTVPGQAAFTIDSRHPDDDTVRAVAEDVQGLCARLAEDAGLGFVIEPTAERTAVAFDDELVARLRAAARRLGLAQRDIYSGAGHDACNLARIAPTAMIFVPCEGGISHNEAENAKPEDLAAGCDLLLQAMVERAGVAG
jgi:N-carbamoyl-L-amino-acid hydrolase